MSALNRLPVPGRSAGLGKIAPSLLTFDLAHVRVRAHVLPTLTTFALGRDVTHTVVMPGLTRHLPSFLPSKDRQVPAQGRDDGRDRPT